MTVRDYICPVCDHASSRDPVVKLCPEHEADHDERVRRAFACSGSCYSEFEEGRPCSRHGRPAPTASNPEAPPPAEAQLTDLQGRDAGVAQDGRLRAGRSVASKDVSPVHAQIDGDSAATLAEDGDPGETPGERSTLRGER